MKKKLEKAFDFYAKHKLYFWIGAGAVALAALLFYGFKAIEAVLSLFGFLAVGEVERARRLKVNQAKENAAKQEAALQFSGEIREAQEEAAKQEGRVDNGTIKERKDRLLDGIDDI